MHGDYCSGDTRTPDSDTSGQLIQKLLKDQGHSVAAYHLVKDEPEQIKARIAEHLLTITYRPSSLTVEQGFRGGIRPSRPSMGC